MNIKDFYAEVGGNYEEVLLALVKEERILKFVLMFPNNSTIDNLKIALDEKDYQTAFREAHNLKGMSINIGLKNLHKVSSDLTESLRNGPTGDVEGLYKLVEAEYKKTCDLINQIDK